MENNEIKTKNKIIPIIIIIFLLLVIVFLCLYSFTDIFKRDISDNNSNGEITENKEETPIKKYLNYTYMDDLPTTDMDKKLVLEVKDGNLTATIDGEALQVNGLEGEVKSFITGNTCGGRHQILVITKDNKLFVTHYNINGDPGYSKFDKNVPLNFNEIKSNEEIVDITKQRYAGITTCGADNTAVVLNSGEVRMVYTDSENAYKFGTLNYSLIKTVINNIVLYQDNTISKKLEDGNNGQIESKVSYNNEELKIEKYFSVGYNKGYAISNDKLYELTSVQDKNNPMLDEKIDVSLVKESNVFSEKINSQPTTNNISESAICPNDENLTYYDKGTDTITFEDGTTFEITGITSIYNNK